MSKRKSLVYTNGEITEMNRRLNGDFSDKSGIWSNRGSKKTKEVLELFKHKEFLEWLVENKREFRKVSAEERKFMGGE